MEESEKIWNIAKWLLAKNMATSVPRRVPLADRLTCSGWRGTGTEYGGPRYTQ